MTDSFIINNYIFTTFYNMYSYILRHNKANRKIFEEFRIKTLAVFTINLILKIISSNLYLFNIKIYSVTHLAFGQLVYVSIKNCSYNKTLKVVFRKQDKRPIYKSFIVWPIYPLEIFISSISYIYLDERATGRVWYIRLNKAYIQMDAEKQTWRW